MSGMPSTAPLRSPYTYVEASVTIDGVEFPRVGLRKKGFIGSQSTSQSEQGLQPWMGRGWAFPGAPPPGYGDFDLRPNNP